MSCLRTSPPECIVYPCCPSEDGCIPGVCPNFIIKRHDTMPPFKYSVTDDDGEPLDLTGLVLEASMWAKGKLKKDLSVTDGCLQLANNVGFQQAMPGDIIVLDRVRNSERMLITGFDEITKTIQVERAVQGTTVSVWKKGTPLRIFRFMSSPATTEMKLEDIQKVDGGTDCDHLAESFLVYNWTSNDTCVPGCYYLEFKLLSMDANNIVAPSVITCFSGIGVGWVRRFPVCGDGFLIKICDSPTQELA
jgi:hypothetical protein